MVYDGYCNDNPGMVNGPGKMVVSNRSYGLIIGDKDQPVVG